MEVFFYPIRVRSPISGVSGTELTAMLACLKAEKKTSRKPFVLRAGDTAESIGLVLTGTVLVIQEDIWGNRNILSKAGLGRPLPPPLTPALPGSRLNVSVVAENARHRAVPERKRILTVCPSACSYHSRIIRNLLGELAGKTAVQRKKAHPCGPAQPVEDHVLPLRPEAPAGDL